MTSSGGTANSGRMASPARTARPGRLSLRARLLVLLILVTAVFLLVMGGVSTFVLSERLGGQFNTELIAAAQRSPRQIASNPGDYVAVEVSLLPLTVRPLTGNSAAARELTTAVQDLIATHTARRYVGGRPFAVPDRPRAGPARPDGQHRASDHLARGPDRADARRR
jgi:hypothetical protein